MCWAIDNREVHTCVTNVLHHSMTGTCYYGIAVSSQACTCMHAYTQACVHTYMHTYTRAHTHTHTHTLMHTCARTHTHAHAHTHTHTHAHAHSFYATQHVYCNLLTLLIGPFRGQNLRHLTVAMYGALRWAQFVESIHTYMIVHLALECILFLPTLSAHS